MTLSYFEIDPNVEYVKIHGLQRSGTNYISHIINENFEGLKCLVNVGGWKHGHYSAPWMIRKEVHVVCVVKNPYSWLVSIYNYWGPNRKKNIGPDLSGVKFEDFVRNRVFFERQNDIPYIYRAQNPIQHWNNMNCHWLSIRMNKKKLCFLSYESFLNDLSSSVKSIENALGVKRKTSEVLTTTNVLLPSGEDIKKGNESFEQTEYYLKNEFLKYYTPELLEFVNQEIDLDLMVHFGYNVFSVEDLEKTQKESGE